MNGLPDPSHSRAVLIGTSRFDTLEPLPAVQNNLWMLAKLLRDDSIWGLPAEHCVIIEDPETSKAMLDPVLDAAHKTTDTLVVYFAGHGLIDPKSGELHLALVGSDPERIYTAVPYHYVRDALQESQAGRHIVVLDCCYSGRAFGLMGGNLVSTVVDEVSAEGTYMMTAAAENKRSLAEPGEDYTAFTAELLATLHHGIPGRGQLLDLDTIFKQIRAEMRAKSRPLPQRSGRNTAGQLTLIRNRAHRRTLIRNQARRERRSMAPPEPDRAWEEAARRAQEADRTVQEEAKRPAREEPDRRVREEADRTVQEEAKRPAREWPDRRVREEADRTVQEEAKREAREAAKRQADALRFLETIQKLQAGTDPVASAIPANAEHMSPGRREFDAKAAAPGFSWEDEDVVEAEIVDEDLPVQSKWTANLLKSSNYVRRLFITLGHETHTLEVTRHEWQRDSISLDGKIITRPYDMTKKTQTFSISDRQEMRAAELSVKSQTMSAHIKGMTLIVDGRIIYQE